MDACLEMLSPLANCSVDNVSIMSVQMVFKFSKVMQQHEVVVVVVVGAAAAAAVV